MAVILAHAEKACKLKITSPAPTCGFYFPADYFGERVDELYMDAQHQWNNYKLIARTTLMIWTAGKTKETELELKKAQHPKKPSWLGK